MRNFEDYKLEYQPADEVQYTFEDYLRYTKNFVFSVIKIVILIIPELFKGIQRIFNPKKPKNITGQLALVTGGGNGLGREISLRLAQEGCNVVIGDWDLKCAEKTVKEIQAKFNVTAKAFRCDVSKFDQVQKLKVEIESSVGTVDILVNNAGLLPYLAWHEGSPEDIDKIIDINLKAHFWVKFQIKN